MNKLMRDWILVLWCVFLVPHAVAQETTETATADVATATMPETAAEKAKNTGDKKMIRDATISLQTTVTGNQEQPRVMYILPWQSPLSPDLDIEMLDNQQDAVFGHVEREELQRGLEAAGEFDQED